MDTNTFTIHTSKESFEKYLGPSLELAVTNLDVDYLKSLTSSGIDVKKTVDANNVLVALWNCLGKNHIKSLRQKSRNMITYLLEEVHADVTKVFHFISTGVFLFEFCREGRLYNFYVKLLIKYGAELRFKSCSDILLYNFVGGFHYDLLNHLVFTGISSEELINLQRRIDIIDPIRYHTECQNYLRPCNITVLSASIDSIGKFYVQPFLRFCVYTVIETTFSLEIILQS